MKIAGVEISDKSLNRTCQKWKIRQLALFGSALVGTLAPDSDIDLLVDFDTGEQWSLMDLVRAESEFSSLFARRVELVDRKNLERSANWIRRNAILDSAVTVYAA
ncbi:MAG: nucleotidyltransferase [Acidobacteria bacterium]|nr:MAG: nucleotidyltransferase [Acidobacteriota bacterium]